MKPNKQIAENATVAQRTAADVGQSIWVSAHAGTGKTTVLTNRLLLLLLQNPPQSIVALTFTKTAAANMLAKLRKELAAWAAAETIGTELENLLQRPATAEECATARRLYDVVLDTPPYIMTCHSFCQWLLQQFPLEAGLTPHFASLEEGEVSGLLGQALENVVVAEEQAARIEGLLTFLTEETLRKAVLFAVRLPADLRNKERLAADLGVPATTTWVDVTLDDALPEWGRMEALHSTCPDLLAAGVKMQTLAQDFQQVYEAYKAGERQGEAYVKLFMTKDFTPTKSFPAKAIAAKYPLWQEEQQRVVTVWEGYKNRRSFCSTCAVLELADAVAAQYVALKQARGAVDFDDLIEKAEQLLQNPNYAAWVRYKLDQTFRHVLVDEAQDTNWAQKRVVDALSEDFFSGAGAYEDGDRTAPRTVFVVGDAKQSIYRFQGAQAEVFQGFRDDLTQKTTTFATVDMQTSFRSTPAVLAVVDALRSQKEKATADAKEDAKEDEFVPHVSAYPDGFGEVRLWPVCHPPQPEKTEVDYSWRIPTAEAVDAVQNGWDMLAEKVAATAVQMAEKEPLWLSKQERYADYGDMLVLLRGHAKERVMLHAFHQAGVPVVVAGGEKDARAHPLVQDCTALLAWLAQPAQDWPLLHVWKSPFCNGTDDEIVQVSLREKGESLWQALCARGSALPAVGFLQRLLALKGAGASPSAVLQVALFGEGESFGRGAFISRFAGAKTAADFIPPAVREMVHHVLDAVLAQVHSLESQALGWDEVVHHLQEQPFPLPALANTAGAVRVMTIHAAKGLEAPIVFLPETIPAKAPPSPAFLTKESQGVPQGMLLKASPPMYKTAFQAQLAVEEKQRQTQDDDNLWYVALTRAEERVYVGGVLSAKVKQIPEESWYGQMQALASVENGWRQEGEDWVYSTGVLQPQALAASAVVDASVRVDVTPLQHPVGQAIFAEAPAVSAEQEAAMAYGTAVHAALEVGPRGRFAPNIQAVVQPIFESFPHLFGAGARAEVDIPLLDGTWGRVDKLVMTADEIQIYDFKTESVVPTEVPPAYAKQVQGYVQALAQAYPEKTVQGFVLWVKTAEAASV